MKLAVYSIQGTIFEGEAEKVIARTPMGEIAVLDNHIPLISSLLGPELRTVDNKGKENTLKIVSGFLEVKPESEVVVLASLAT